MITLPLFDFQQNAVQKLLGLTESLTSKQKIIVKSPTGSGKTVILVEYIDEYLDAVLLALRQQYIEYLLTVHS